MAREGIATTAETDERQQLTRLRVALAFLASSAGQP